MRDSKYSVKSPEEDTKRTYVIFIWHGAFLALTMSMLDYNTVFPALVANLTESKIIFGLLYSIMLGTPFIFNIILSSFMHTHRYKKRILLFGIYLRSLSFLGMAVFAWLFGKHLPMLVIGSLFFWIFLYSISGGFAGMAYSDIIGKLIKRGQRGKLFASKQFATGIFSFLGGVVILNIFTLHRLSFPYNYTIILLIGSAGLLVASIAFWFIREPSSIIRDKEKVSFKLFIKKVPSILKKDTDFTRFIIVENMFSFSLMIYPFYMLYAKDILFVNETYVGRYLIFQTAGAVLSNFLWVVISSKWGSKMVLKACILIGSLTPVLAIILSKFGPGYYSLVFFLVGFLISGRAVGFESYILDIAPSDSRIIYLGIRGTMNIFIVLLPVAGGYFITYLGYYVTFFIVAAVTIAAFFLLEKQKIK
jgi:MFS family permease